MLHELEPFISLWTERAYWQGTPIMIGIQAPENGSVHHRPVDRHYIKVRKNLHASGLDRLPLCPDAGLNNLGQAAW